MKSDSGRHRIMVSGERLGYTKFVLRAKPSGVTIIETIIALSLLFSGILLVIALMHSAERYRSKGKRLAIAIMLSENAIANAREWARTPANFDSDWSGLGASYSEADWPGYQVDLQVAQPNSNHPSNIIYSPCEKVEAISTRPNLQQRALRRSIATLKTTCQWGNSDEVLILLTNIGEPDRIPDAANPFLTQRTGPGDPLAINQSVEFTASLLDASGAAIPDVALDWSARGSSRPGVGPGAATLTVLERFGGRASLKHIYMRNPMVPDAPPNNPARWQWVGGLVGVTPEARYKGRLYPLDPNSLSDEVLLESFP